MGTKRNLSKEGRKMLKNRRKGIATRILSAFLAIALTITLCPNDLGYVMAEEEIEMTTVSGGVQNGDTNAIVGATVTVFDAEGVQIGITTTDENGNFTVDVAKAPVLVTASKDGYKSGANASFTISDTATDIVLSLEAKEERTLAFDAETASVALGGTITKTATLSDGEGVITYSSSATNVATVDANTGVVTPISVGETTITATCAENNDYKQATDTYTLTVTKASQGALVWSSTDIPTDLTWKDMYANTVTGGSGEGAVIYSSNNETVATVDSNTGIVTLKYPGTVTITATKAGDAMYAEQTASYTLTVNKAERNAYLSETVAPAITTAGGRYQINVVCDDANVFKTYSSSNDNCAAPSNDGSVIGRTQPGVATITVTIVGDDLYEEKVMEMQIEVVDKTTSNTVFRLSKGTVKKILAVGETYVNTGLNGSGSYTYTSSAQDVATVDGGTVTAKAVGNTTITVSDGSTQLSYEVEVVAAKQSVTFADTNPVKTVSVGEIFTNAATAETSVTYTSSDSTIAQVDANTGEVTPLKEGSVIITATAVAGQYEEASATYALRVNAKTQTVSFDEPTVTVTYGQDNNKYTQEANSTAAGETGNTVTYSIVSGNNKATVDPSTGEVTITGVGTIVIKATYSGNNEYSSASATYTITVDAGSQTLSFPALQYTTYMGEEFEEPLLDESLAPGGGTITYASDNTDAAEVNSTTGEITLVGVGEAKITATKSADSNYNGTSASYTLKVEKKRQTIAFPKGAYEIYTGEAFVAPTADETSDEYNGEEIVYAVEEDTNGIINEIDSATGQVTLSGKTGTATIKATKPGDETFAEATATYTLTVVQWTANGKYTITDSTGVTGDVWFKKDVLIKANEGYEILLDGEEETEWASEKVAVTDDATTKPISFYVKDVENGYLSSKITETVKKDGTVPSAVIQYEGQTWWDTFLLFFNQDADKEYTITSSDATSGVTSVQYYIDEDNTVVKTAQELDSVTSWADYSDTEHIDVAKGKKYVIYAKVTDAAGNYVYATTNGIVHDIAEPQVTFDPVSQGNNFNNTIFSDDINLTITVTDSAPYSGIKSVTWQVLNDTEEKISGTHTAENTGNVKYDELRDSFTKELNLEKEVFTGDKILVKVTVEDFAGNETDATTEYVIDAKLPAVTLNFTDSNAAVNTVGDYKYFTASKTAEVVITGRSSLFDADEATNSINITVKDVNGDLVSGDSYAISNWTTTEGATDDLDTHKATIEFTKDATYEVSVDYKNGMNISAVAPTPLKFVIDREVPVVDILIHGDNESNNIGNIYDGNIRLAVEVTDANASSGISKFEYEVLCDGQKTQDEVINVTENTDENTFDIVIDKDKNQGDEIILKVKAYDRCLNEGTAEDTYVINTTKPTIDVIFDDDIASQIKDGTGYFTAGRKATVVFTCRESLFDAVTATDGIAITAKDGFGTEVSDAYVISGWSTTLGNKDVEDKHTVTVKFNKDAIYTFDVSYTNELNQAADEMNTGDSVTPKSFVIDTVAPKVTVAYTQADNNPKVFGDKGYFNGSRTATITVDEKISFAKEDVNITITAKDSADEKVLSASECKELVSDFVVTPDNKYQATIEYTDDANYTFAISYTDKAGHDADISTGDSIAPNNFVVDIEAPKGKISVKNKDRWSWESFLETITFGLYNSNQDEQVIFEATDETSGVDTVDYYRTTTAEIYSIDDLKAVGDDFWNEYDEQNPIIISPDSKVVVYARIVDKLGHTTYLCSNGIILEANNPVVVEKVQPEVSLTPEELASTVFSGNVQVGVKVEEPTEDVLYSGLKSVTYQVYNLGNPEPTQEGILFELDENTNDFVTDWASTENESNSYITVDAEKNHSNSVVVKVIAYDRAGNKGEAEVTLKIDTTAPQISVSFDNNDGDTSFSDTTYFNKARTATITIREDNFDPARVSLLSNGASALNWSSSASNANGDGGVHKASVTFASDGDYTFGISCTDKAGRASGAVDYGNSLAPMKFTVDITEPQVTVSYDNNNALNGNYYKDTRIATIQVKEHNFEVSRVNFVVTATDNGQQAALPALSNWVSNGDTHTATVVYDKDALYTFDFDYTDKAGNKAADIPMNTFYVDMTAPKVSITNIVDESANSGDGNIGFSITATDTNFDVFTPVLTAVVKEGDKFVEKQISGGGFSNIGNGQVFTIRNVDLDGIYRIACTVVDKAGNAYTEVSLQNKDGSTYVEQRTAADTLATFSVNRQGSAYELDKTTMEIVEQYYVQNVDEDVVLVEVNTNALKEYKVTLNGKELKEGTDYTVATEGGYGEWMKYLYSIKKSLFDAEGQYQIVVSSKDEANNDAFSDVKDATVTFVVDRTAPVVTVTGLETDGRYQVERQTVTIIPTDDGGALKSLLVRTVDEDGKELVKLVDLSGDELTTALDENDGKIAFEIEEGLYQNVQIICTDCAIDSEGNTNTYNMTFYQVSVSSSAVKMLFASKGMRYGIIGGIVLIIGGVALLVFRKKKVTK